MFSLTVALLALLWVQPASALQESRQLYQVPAVREPGSPVPRRTGTPLAACAWCWTFNSLPFVLLLFVGVGGLPPVVREAREFSRCSHKLKRTIGV